MSPTAPATGRPRSQAAQTPASSPNQREETPPMTDPVDWRHFAACQDTDDPELFFPTGQSVLARRQVQAAKQICARCPVRVACLDWAIGSRQYTGVWGGLSEAERQGLYETPEKSFTRCLNAQEWIEEQLARGVFRRDLARQLGVDHGVLGRAVQQMRFERDTLAAVEGAAA